MALLGAALRLGGGALARNITGRKKRIKPSAIAPEKVMNQETPKKGGGLVKRPTSKTALAKPMKPLQMASTSAVSKDDPLKVIHVKVIEIESILKGTLAAEKEEQKRKKQELQDQKRAQQEEGLEKNPKKKPDKKPKMPLKMPSGGIFGFIKNIIGSFIMNYFVKFLIDNAKTVANILKVVVSVTDFLAEAGIQIFNALATFVDWGYKAIDATRGFIKTLGGEGLAQNFDKVTNLVGTALFLATTITTSMAVEALMGDDDGGGGSPGRTRGRRGRARRPIFRRLPKIKGPGLRGGILSAIFAALEFGGRKAEGQTNVQAGVGSAGSTLGGALGFKAGLKGGAALGATIGAFFGGVGAAPGALIGGALGSLLGGFGGSMLGGAAADKLTGVKQYQEGGGVVPGRKPVTRTIENIKKKPKKFFLKKPVKQPPLKVPESKDKDEKKVITKISNIDNAFSENDYFGPIISATSKIILDDPLDSTDYNNIGRGINLLINEGLGDEKIAKGMIGYQSGGMIDTPPQFLDVESWAQDTFKKVSKKVTGIARVYGSTAGPKTRAGERDSATGQLVSGTETGMITALGSGGGSLKDMSDQDFSDLAFIVSHEALRGTDDEYAVAAAVLNRVADPRYPNTIMGVGTAPGQFEAVFSGKAYRDEALAKQLKENQGKIIDALKKLDGRTDFKAFSSMGEFMGETDIMFADNGNFYHYAEQRGKADPIPSNIPQDWKKLLGESTGEQFTASASVAPPSLPDTPGNTDASGGGDVSVSGSDIVNIGKDLASKGFAVAEHPDFTKDTSGGRYTPGKGYVSNVHRGDGHYEGRAIDVTQHKGGDPEYKQTYLPVLNSLANNPAIKMLIHDTWGFYKDGKKSGPGSHGHPQHMHIEVKDRGGFIGKGLFANLGGTEFVTDADSTAALKQVAPGLMMALNQARDAKGVQSALQQYASYEQGAAQTIMIDDSSEDMSAMSEEQSPMPSFVMPSGSNTYDNSFDFLDYQG